MTPEVPVAAIDPIPLPAPLWLLQGLLLLTFTLHVVPMSVTLGGGFWAILAARSGAHNAGLATLAGRLGKALPYWTAATITTGVAALLFLQVLYGHLFFSASVTMAGPWLAVVAILLIAYSGYYLRSLRFAQQPRLAFWVGLIAWLGFVVIAFIYSNQMTLMLRPERVHALYLANPGGMVLNWGEPTLLARYLHMVIGALAVAALLVAGYGARAAASGDEAAGRDVLRFGVRGFLVTTLVNSAIGFWFLFSIPDRGWLLVMGGNMTATISFALSLPLTLVGCMIVWKSGKADRPMRKLVVGGLHILAVVICMVLMRDGLRKATAGAAADLAAVPVEPQWTVITLFFVFLLAGLALVAWMVRLLSRPDEQLSPPVE